MPTKKSLSKAIYISSDWSSSSTTCIEYIRLNLEESLKPIADMLKAGNPEKSSAIEKFFSDTEFAAEIQSAIWPSGGEGAIPERLKRTLEPIAKSLDAIDSYSARDAAKRLRELCKHEDGDTSYARRIVIDPRAVSFSRMHEKRPYESGW